MHACFSDRASVLCERKPSRWGQFGTPERPWGSYYTPSWLPILPVHFRLETQRPPPHPESGPGPGPGPDPQETFLTGLPLSPECNFPTCIPTHMLRTPQRARQGVLSATHSLCRLLCSSCRINQACFWESRNYPPVPLKIFTLIQGFCSSEFRGQLNKPSPEACICLWATAATAPWPCMGFSFLLGLHKVGLSPHW